MKKVIALIGALASTAIAGAATQAHAAGYAFFEQSAAATGRGGAVIASPLDASTGFYNTAGISALKGLTIDIGGTFVLPVASYESSLGTVDRTQRGTFPPYAHIYYGNGQWGAGLSFYNAWGLGMDWPKGFPGLYVIDRLDLKTPTFQPSFSFRPNAMFSFGAGVTITNASAELIRQVPVAPFPAGQVYLGADGAWGIGATAGVLITPRPNFRIGLTYRSAMKLSFEGKADFTFSNTIPASVRANLPSDQKGGLELTTPHVIGAGIAWDITPDLTVELDANQYFWSVFEELRLKFGPSGAGNPVPGNCTPASAAGTDPRTVAQHVCSNRQWKDVIQFRLGAEWRVRPDLRLRAGYIFDLTPVPSTLLDPTLPDANRHDFSLGIGYDFNKNFHMDFAYMLVYFTERKAPAALVTAETGPGTYNTTAHLFAINLGFKF